MNTLFDYYVMLNYIVYKFYLRREKKELDARLTSIMLSSLYLYLPFFIINGLICIFSCEFQLLLRQIDKWVYAVPLLSFATINYLLLYYELSDISAAFFCLSQPSFEHIVLIPD